MELAIVLFMLLIVVAIGALKLADHGVSFPFRKKQQLFTQVEHTFINLLEQAVGREFRIVSRVRLNDLLAVRNSANKRQARQALPSRRRNPGGSPRSWRGSAFPESSA